ncbi:MAG: acetyl-CoA carboxylase biotin carboxyl carrier protein subunit, partial [Deltaproteobacteria bacterium]|nr:acetyl-CoA carboxylase biotin carboxyl carrier protein subunit [Deltaproteobacteria bacterium]
MSEIKAPMGGKILDVKVVVGDAVNEGDEVVILEAMKMELPVV